jgi:predicted lipoprotein with Yx(FWY)xxD motif
VTVEALEEVLMRTYGRARPLALAATIGVVVLAGCASSSSVKASAPASAAPASAAPPTTGAAPTTTAAPVGLNMASSAKLGAILTDAAGMTLYRNTHESGGTIACTGGCTSAWPPLLVTPGSSLPAAGAGVTGKIASIARPDGGTQVTFNGAPLYHFSGDHQAGDTTGQGVLGIWFVVAPGATSTTTPPTTAAPTPHTTVAPSHAAPTSPPPTPTPTMAPHPSPTPPPTSPPTPKPTMPPPTSCLYPPCY